MRQNLIIHILLAIPLVIPLLLTIPILAVSSASEPFSTVQVCLSMRYLFYLQLLLKLAWMQE
jgi:hypothetical protein